MRGVFYRLVRDLHLYFGLFCTPFVLLFSVSVFFMVHVWLPGIGSTRATTRVVSKVALPPDLQKLSGRELIDALNPVLKAIGVAGEVGFLRHIVQEEKILIPVMIPGRETTVTISLRAHEASITTRETGLAQALVTLHTSPGEHAPAIRMNWIYMKAWRWVADATAYLVLFITVSGIYLWYVLRAERKLGMILLLGGAVTFFGITYAISR